MSADGSEQARIPTEGTLAAAPDWQPLFGSRRSDHEDASHFCKAERDFLGAQEFGQKYGSHGGCVSGQR